MDINELIIEKRVACAISLLHLSCNFNFFPKCWVLEFGRNLHIWEFKERTKTLSERGFGYLKVQMILYIGKKSANDLSYSKFSD